jgi:hypothetical protein
MTEDSELRPDVWMGVCPECGGHDVECVNDSEEVEDWTCWTCDAAWGVNGDIIC